MALSCDRSPGASSATPPPVASAAGTASSEPPPIAGARLLRHGSELYAVHAKALWRAKLPLDGTSPQKVSLPGPAGDIAIVGDEVLVAVREPSVLLRLRRQGEQLVEAGRIPVPGGAIGLAATGDGETALVTSLDGHVSAVSLASASKPRWSIEVAALPRRVVIAPKEDAAYVSHPAGLTRIDSIRDTPDPAAVLTRAEDAVPVEQLLDPVVSVLPSAELVVAYGLFPDGRPGAHIARMGEGKLAEASALPPVAPSFGHARAILRRPGSATLLVATDREVLELDDALAVVKRRPTDRRASCADPEGLALSEDEGILYILCADALAALPLERGEERRIPLGPSNTTPRVDCGDLPAGPVADEHEGRFGTASQIAEWLRRYHCRHPELTDLVEIGKSHEGRPIHALFIGRGQRLDTERPTVLLNGAHHGSELMSTTFVLDAIATLLERGDPRAERWLDEVVVVAMPLVNPDGNSAYLERKLLGRKNGRDNDNDGQREGSEGVDLNRNYPFRWGALGERGSSSDKNSRYYRGLEAASEPETRAMMRLAERERFASSISYHTGTLAILAPYTIPEVDNPVPNEAWTVAEQIAKQVKGHPEGFVPVRRNLYPVDGTDQDWFRWAHGTLALLVEGVDNYMVEPGARAKVLNAIRSTWTVLIDRYLDGPTLAGRVLDAVGRPVQAEVSIAEIYRPEKERWTTRCRDGHYDRYLHKAGSYTLKVTAPGMAPVSVAAPVGKAREQKDVVLPLLVVEAAECSSLDSEESSAAKLVALPGAAHAP